MPKQPKAESIHQLRTERLRSLLQQLLESGLTQQQIAARTSVSSQFISDLKRGDRNVSELFARRFSEEFKINYLWLMGQSGSAQLRPALPLGGGVKMTLPILPHPIRGQPEEAAIWSGEVIEVFGVAAKKASQAEMPYVLRLGKTDPEKRFRKGDLLLISQSPSEDADISVVGRKPYFLARRNEGGQWEKVYSGTLPDNPEVIGHCLGIIWGDLVPR